MKNFIKKYKYIIIAVVCAAAILTGAFFAGESLGEKKPDLISLSTADTVTEEKATNLLQIESSSVTKTEKQEKETVVKAENQPSTIASTAPQSKSEQSSASKQSESKPSSSSSKPAQTSDSGKKDKYQTEKIPQDKPKPVEPQEQEIKDNTLKCTFSISCATVLNNMDSLDSGKREIIPDDGWILKPVTVTFNEGESVFDVLQRVCRENKIHLEFSLTPIYNSAYIEGINNLYEFDCGSLSGWTYSVNGWFPNYGCSRYEIKNGDTVNWHYTCNLGEDVGGNNGFGE